jgi:hypothetical protein
MTLKTPAIIGKQKSSLQDFIKFMPMYIGPDKHYDSFLHAFHGVEDEDDLADMKYFLGILTAPPNENSESPYRGTVAYLRVYRDKPLEFIHSILADWNW